MTGLKDTMLGDRLATYPYSPGHKVNGTSQEAARRVAPVAGTLRDKVLLALKLYGPLTPDETAEKLGMSILSIRPRFSELHRLGLIEQTSERRTNDSGHRAEVWRVKP